MTCCVCFCRLRWLRVANYGRRKVAVTHLCQSLCTFGRRFGRQNWGGQWWDDAIIGGRSHAGGVFLGCLRVIYRSTYVGIVLWSLIFETSLFLTSTSKIRESTTSTILRQLIFRYEDSVCDPQTGGVNPGTPAYVGYLCIILRRQKHTSRYICITPLLVKLAYFLPPKKLWCDT